MDFKSSEVKEAFAEFLQEKIKNSALTIEELAAKAGYSTTTIHNYLNLKKAPEQISDKFYTTMQSVLNFQHNDFRQYYEDISIDKSQKSIGNLNISNSTFKQTVFGAQNVHFHNADDNKDD
ncbi:hypothetical protein [Sessilibacter corallicola]|uniref:HTH cro/C1-type domain-containing protein n=1 Tax=Sessilibacter corallicola TaxID=2904075 RepID=A0ABQ0ADB3_9GAMM